jgi:hypothetical protein
VQKAVAAMPQVVFAAREAGWQRPLSKLLRPWLPLEPRSNGSAAKLLAQTELVFAPTQMAGQEVQILFGV